MHVGATRHCDKKADNPHEVDVAEPAFVLDLLTKAETDRTVIFSQSDSRYVQLAKSAISAGTDLMVKETVSLKRHITNLSRGAFRNYLNDRECALYRIASGIRGADQSDRNGAAQAYRFLCLTRA
jgi:hypothetical protein